MERDDASYSGVHVCGVCVKCCLSSQINGSDPMVSELFLDELINCILVL